MNFPAPCQCLQLCCPAPQVKFLSRLSSSRIAQCCTLALLPWGRPVEAKRLVSLGCSLCDGLFIARCSGPLDRENARNNETKTSSSYFDVEWFPWSLVRGRISKPVDRRLHDRKHPHTPHKLPNPHSLLAVSCQKWPKLFKPPCEGKHKEICSISSRSRVLAHRPCPKLEMFCPSVLQLFYGCSKVLMTNHGMRFLFLFLCFSNRLEIRAQLP